MLCINKFLDCQEWDRIYYEIPILKYINTQDFMNKFLSMNFDYQDSCFWTFSERYKSSNFPEVLQEELPWVENIQKLLLEKAEDKQYKLRGYRLKLLNKEYLDKAIENIKKQITKD